MSGLTVPLNDSPDAAALPWLAAALSGLIPVSSDALSAYSKEMETFAGKAIYGLTEAGQ